MRLIALTTWKDLLRLRDPAALLAWLAMPAIILGLMTMIFRDRPSPAPQGKLLIVDHDRTLFSGILRGIFARAPLSSMITVELTDFEAGRKRADQGDAAALLDIPAGFGASAMSGRPAALTLWTNPAQRILPGIITSALSMALADFEANRATPNLAAYINPPLINVRTQSAKPATTAKPVSFAALFFPGMLLFGVFGLAQSLSEDIWRERSSGTLRRVRTTSISLAQFMAGKAISLALVVAVYTAIGLVAARFALSVPIRNFPLALLWVVGAGVGLYLMASLLQAVSSEQRAGVVFNGFVLFLFSLVGGSFFPFELMPPWLANLGRLIPNGWAIARFKELLAGPVDPLEFAIHLGIMAVFLGVMFSLLTRRLRSWT